MRHIFYLSFLLLFLSSCSKAETSNEEVAVDQVKFVAPKLSQDSKSYASNEQLNTPKISQKIVKEASLRFETDDLNETYNKIQKAITANTGNILNDTEGKNYDNISRVLVIKVPGQNFNRFIDAVSKGVSYFDEKQISAEDVTEQYIDLTSRLKTKKKLEERYLQILQKATKVSEILEIEKQISAIREEIEAKEGQLKYLESRVSESTITIEFYKTIPEKEGVKISYGSKLWSAIESGFYTLSDLLLSLLSAWPFVILFVVFAYFIRRRLKRRKKE